MSAAGAYGALRGKGREGDELIVRHAELVKRIAYHLAGRLPPSVAVDDLIEENSFTPVGHDGGPYALHIRVAENRLVFDIRLSDDTPVVIHMLSLNPFKRVVKDYFLVCDSYYAAIKSATPERIEALDMGRRALHDEGSRLLQERIKHRVVVDFNTARRLFTLVCALHWKG